MFDWIINIIEQSGYAGVLFGMFVENIFPPIPSELIMLYSGISAKQGDLNIIFVILFGILGSALGLVPWYYAGKWYGQERMKEFAQKHGRFLTVSESDVDKADEWFNKHGKKAVFFGRFLPAIRTLIAIPAAIGGMRLQTLIVFALLGSAAYDALFAVIGYIAGDNDALRQYVDVGTYITFVIVVVWYFYRVLTFQKVS